MERQPYARAWKIAGGYAYQDAFIVSTTTAAVAGAQVAQAPHHTFSFYRKILRRREPIFQSGITVSS
jgi:outer membrane receptor for monomeric catechols